MNTALGRENTWHTSSALGKVMIHSGARKPTALQDSTLPSLILPDPRAWTAQQEASLLCEKYQVNMQTSIILLTGDIDHRRKPSV